MTPHPTDSELSAFIDGLRSPSVAAHLERCAECRMRVDRAGESVPIPSAETWSTVQVSPSPVSEPSVPSVGEIWRVVWDHACQLGLVVDDRPEGFVVVPLLVDPNDDADEWTLLLNADASSLGFDTGVAVAHRFTLPLFVFDGRVGEVDADVIDVVANGVRAFRRNERPAWPTGPAVRSLLDPRAERIASLGDDFASLSDASWLEQFADSNETDWDRYLDAVDPEPDRFYELMNGAVPTVEEIAAAEAAGIMIATPGFADDLVYFLDLPAQSARLRRHASSHGIPEAVERREAARAMTNRRFALAARNDAAEFDWAPLLEEYLNETRS